MSCTKDDIIIKHSGTPNRSTIKVQIISSVQIIVLRLISVSPKLTGIIPFYLFEQREESSVSLLSNYSFFKSCFRLRKQKNKLNKNTYCKPFVDLNHKVYKLAIYLKSETDMIVLKLLASIPSARLTVHSASWLALTVVKP